MKKLLMCLLSFALLSLASAGGASAVVNVADTPDFIGGTALVKKLTVTYLDFNSSTMVWVKKIETHTANPASISNGTIDMVADGVLPVTNIFLTSNVDTTEAYVAIGDPGALPFFGRNVKGQAHIVVLVALDNVSIDSSGNVTNIGAGDGHFLQIFGSANIVAVGKVVNNVGTGTARVLVTPYETNIVTINADLVTNSDPTSSTVKIPPIKFSWLAGPI